MKIGYGIYRFLDVINYTPVGTNLKKFAKMWGITDIEKDIFPYEWFDSAEKNCLTHRFRPLRFFTIRCRIQVARRRTIKKPTKLGRKKLNEKLSENITNAGSFTILAFILIPIIDSILLLEHLKENSIPFLAIIAITMVWWLYQLLKLIKYIMKNGFKEIKFNISLILYFLFPIFALFWLIPSFILIGLDSWTSFVNINTLELDTIITFIVTRIFDIFSIVILDFVIITVIATFTVGFAEGNSIGSLVGVVRGEKVKTVTSKSKKSKIKETLNSDIKAEKKMKDSKIDKLTSESDSLIENFTSSFKIDSLANDTRIEALISDSRIITLIKAVSLITVWISLLFAFISSLWNQIIEAIQANLPELNFPGLLPLLEEYVFTNFTIFV